MKYMCVKTLYEILEKCIIDNAGEFEIITIQDTGSEILYLDEYEILWKGKSVPIHMETEDNYYVCVGSYDMEICKSGEDIVYDIVDEKGYPYLTKYKKGASGI